MFVRVLNRVFLPFNLSIKIKSARGTRLLAPRSKCDGKSVSKLLIHQICYDTPMSHKKKSNESPCFGSGERDTKQFQRVHLITQSRHFSEMLNCLKSRLKTTKRSVRINKVSSGRIALASAADGVNGNQKEKLSIYIMRQTIISSLDWHGNCDHNS